MDQNTFNYWYHKYVESYGIHPPSYNHLQQFITLYMPYNIPYYMPAHILTHPMQMLPIPQVPQVPQVQSIESSENSNNIILNKKYGLQTKDDCSNGMKCTNVYCKFFHHPSADPNIFLQNK